MSSMKNCRKQARKQARIFLNRVLDLYGSSGVCWEYVEEQDPGDNFALSIVSIPVSLSQAQRDAQSMLNKESAADLLERTAEALEITLIPESITEWCAHDFTYHIYTSMCGEDFSLGSTLWIELEQKYLKISMTLITQMTRR